MAAALCRRFSFLDHVFSAVLLLFDGGCGDAGPILGVERQEAHANECDHRLSVEEAAAPDECAPVSADVATQADIGSPPAKKTRFGVDRRITREELEHMIAEIESRPDKKWHRRTMRLPDRARRVGNASHDCVVGQNYPDRPGVARMATNTSHIRTKTVELTLEVAELRRALGREKKAHQDVLMMLKQLREEQVTLNKQLAAVLASATSEPKVTIGGAGQPEKVITCTLCYEDHKEELCQRFPTATDRPLKAIEAELCLKCTRHPARVKFRHQKLRCPKCGSEAHLPVFCAKFQVTAEPDMAARCPDQPPRSREKTWQRGNSARVRPGPIVKAWEGGPPIPTSDFRGSQYL
ncbi:unnamed protein product [Caenorhabditis bovis]|uniref:Uncharacterized protein n=1 Tax=Caenorhabditis bovis TaxID=2654633 RepID=A0A8S1ERR8_9PELO|nr:unnamed protein product [Caenorhabditis bovis]